MIQPIVYQISPSIFPKRTILMGWSNRLKKNDRFDSSLLRRWWSFLVFANGKFTICWTTIGLYRIFLIFVVPSIKSTSSKSKKHGTSLIAVKLEKMLETLTARDFPENGRSSIIFCKFNMFSSPWLKKWASTKIFCEIGRPTHPLCQVKWVSGCSSSRKEPWKLSISNSTFRGNTISTGGWAWHF